MTNIKTVPTTDPHTLQYTSIEHDERFYLRPGPNDTTIFAPSFTHVTGETWPDDGQLARWRGDVGNETADRMMREGAENGNYVHHAIPALFAGEAIKSDEIREAFEPRRSLHVLRCMKGFMEWVEEYNPEPVKLESVTWLDSPRCAGTVDFIGYLTVKGERELWVVDLKSGKSIYDTSKAQVCFYRHSEEMSADGDEFPTREGILHLGSAKLKTKRHSFIDVTPYRSRYLPQALNAISTYHLHHPNAAPSAEQFPEVFAIAKRDEPNA